MADKTPKAPRHLKAATRKWWQSVVSDYQLEAHHLRLLQLACESWDRAQAAREGIAKYGLVYDDKSGTPRARPEVGIERDSRLAFARMLRELSLDVESPADESRPPAIVGKANLKVGN